MNRRIARPCGSPPPLLRPTPRPGRRASAPARDPAGPARAARTMVTRLSSSWSRCALGERAPRGRPGSGRERLDDELARRRRGRLGPGPARGGGRGRPPRQRSPSTTGAGRRRGRARWRPASSEAAARARCARRAPPARRAPATRRRPRSMTRSARRAGLRCAAHRRAPTPSPGRRWERLIGAPPADLRRRRRDAVAAYDVVPRSGAAAAPRSSRRSSSRLRQGPQRVGRLLDPGVERALGREVTEVGQVRRAARRTSPASSARAVRQRAQRRGRPRSPAGRLPSVMAPL